MRKAAEMGFRWMRVYYPELANDAEPYGLRVLLRPAGHIPTRYGAQVPADTPEDVNGDGEVTLLDLVLVSSNQRASH